MAVRQAFHIATTGPAGPTLIDVPKDVLQSTMEWYWPTDAEVADSLPGYRPNVKGHPRMIKEAAQADPRLRAADPLRRRRHPQGPRRRGAARAGRADRHPRRHHADGPRRVPRRPPAVPRHARHARQRDRGRPRCSARPADHARRPVRRPHHRQGRRRSLPRRRSSTSTSTRPSRARSAGPTCRSSATADYVIEELDQGDQGPAGRRHRAGRHRRVEEPDQRVARAVPAHLRARASRARR